MTNTGTTNQKEQETDTSIGKKKQIERIAKAHWQGNLKEGKGTLNTESGVLEETSYSYKTRFEEGEKGTNPEELLAAAHAGCFTMAVVAILSKEGFTPTSLDTKTTVTMEGLAITAVHLAIAGTIPDMNADQFNDITKEAEKNCMISKALNIPITSESYFIG